MVVGAVWRRSIPLKSIGRDERCSCWVSRDEMGAADIALTVALAATGEYRTRGGFFNPKATLGATVVTDPQLFGVGAVGVSCVAIGDSAGA